jgi:CheY-like chemotaxis protein
MTVEEPQTAQENNLSSMQKKLHEQKKDERPNRTELDILIVDDQDFFSSLLVEMLQKPVRAVTCGTLKEGWQHYLKIVPNIVFLDIELPDGKGHDLAQKIKEYDPDSYIIMVTGNRLATDIEKAKQNRIDGYIGKPYNKKQIQDCVQIYKSKRRPAQKISAATGQ